MDVEGVVVVVDVVVEAVVEVVASDVVVVVVGHVMHSIVVFLGMPKVPDPGVGQHVPGGVAFSPPSCKAR